MKRGFKYIEHKGGRIQKVRIRRLTDLEGLGIARGPGSLFGPEAARHAARTGDFAAAVELANADASQSGSSWRTIPRHVIAAWRNYAEMKKAPEVVL